jgi:cell division protein FtsB
MIEHLKLFAKRNLMPKRLLNFVLILSFTVSLFSSIWAVGRKVDKTLSYLDEIPKLTKEVAMLRNEKDATRDSIRVLRYETSEHLSVIRTEFSQVDNRITCTNQNVKMELQKMNDYLLVLSENNAELKRLLLLKKDSDNRLFEHLFSQNKRYNN